MNTKPPHPTKHQLSTSYKMLGAIMIVTAVFVVPLAGVFGIVGWIVEKLKRKERLKIKNER